jgi:carbon-monoxide dehydrogenase medium subunit
MSALASRISAFHRPEDLAAALDLLARLGNPAQPVAGGTDVMMRLRAGRVQATQLVAVGHLRGLPAGEPARLDGDVLTLDALAPLADLLRSEALGAHAGMLADALVTIGSPQVRNVATLAGNICNASPAADSLPPLLALDASLVLASASAVREVALKDFLLGPGRTARRADELLTLVRVPLAAPLGTRLALFRKFGKRRANIIASANVAMVAEALDGRVARLALAAGGVAPTPVRLSGVEALFQGAPLAADLFVAREAELLPLLDAVVVPISDVRGGAAFKRALVLHAVEDLCRRLWELHSGVSEVADG